MEFQQFRNQVYNINHQCQEQERKNYLHVQKEFEEADFNADNISRSSGDSSVFLPRINNKASSSSGKYKDVKSKVQSSISSNSSTMKSRIQRVGGV